MLEDKMRQKRKQKLKQKRIVLVSIFVRSLLGMLAKQRFILSIL